MRDKIEGHPINEIHVHPESRHWFAHVERAGRFLRRRTRLLLAGRQMDARGRFRPPPSRRRTRFRRRASAEFATIPFEFPFARLMEIIKAAVRENLPLAQALEELRRQGHPDLPRAASAPPSAWTPQQEQALAKIINIDDVRRVWMGSLEITELIRRRLAHEISSLGASPFGISSLSSPFGGVGTAEGILVQRQCRTDHLRRDRAGRPRSRSAATKSNCAPTARSVTASRCRTENMICPPWPFPPTARRRARRI